MSEDRTQPASTHRRQMARERGLVVQSPELTAAVGWAIGVILLGSYTQDLAVGMTGVIRHSLSGDIPLTATPAEFASTLRSQTLAVAFPFFLMLIGFGGGAILAHQIQVRGLFAPSQIVPDFARLWSLGGGAGLGARLERNVWGVVKAAVLIGVGGWTIRAVWVDLLRASQLETADLARAAGSIVYRQSIALAVALLVLGGIDYLLRYRRFEAMLRTTPQEQREDQQLVEGDLSLKSRRRQIANARRADGDEILAGASLALISSEGLLVILAGGPPPRKVHVRSALSGKAAIRLRRAVDRAGLPQLESPSLARRLARREYASLAVPPHLLSELALLWPKSVGASNKARRTSAYPLISPELRTD